MATQTPRSELIFAIRLSPSVREQLRSARRCRRGSRLLEPRLTARAVDLRPLVVLIALAFWGLCWGGGGMVLAIPLTVMLRIVWENIALTRPLARLMAVVRRRGERPSGKRSDRAINSILSDLATQPVSRIRGYRHHGRMR